MGNVNNPSQAGFRGETVKSAEYYTRPKLGGGLHVVDHHGVVMKTDKGNSYLLHSTLGGTVVTPASNMSKNWTKNHDIPVSGNKTVGQVFNQASGRTLYPKVNYATSGTCIKTAQNAEKALKSTK